MNEYIIRPTTILELPINNSISLLKPEQAIIDLGRDGKYDIGSYCYKLRSKKSSRLTNSIKLVKIDSLLPYRIDSIKKIITIVSEFKNSGLSGATIGTYIKKLTIFLDWIDINNEDNCFKDKETAKKVLFNYVKYLKEQLIQGKFVSSTAASNQNNVIKFLNIFFDIENISNGINLIRENRGSNQISPPSEDSQIKILSLCESLFNNLSDLILNKREFPYLLKVPEYLGWKDNKFYIFPTIEWAATSDNPKKRVYHHDLGRLYSIEEIKQNYKNYHTGITVLNSALKHIEIANQDFYHIHRIRLAMVAFYSFGLLFLANTGMNKESFLNLTWSDDYETNSNKQGFKTIKHRANNKVCHFEISSGMVSQFKKFLELRKYLLKDNSCDYLFFNLGTNFNEIPKQLSRGWFSGFFDTLKKLAPSLEPISLKDWRTAKSDWLIKNTDVSTTALILQNSERTILKHYSAGSETLQAAEISNFFQEIKKVVIDTNQKIETSSIGGCLNYGKPIPILNTNLKVDCKSPEGCLFCDQYRVHADAIDVRKLLSCQYCLIELQKNYLDPEIYNSYYVPVVKRIDYVLQEIHKINPYLVEKIKQEIAEGELDEYWVRKMELLINLELI